MGFKGAGLLLSAWTKAGGYYMGMSQREKKRSKSCHPDYPLHRSQYIIDGKIKLMNDSQIQGFTANGLKFEDGSEVETDVVVFCTGFVYYFFVLNIDGFSLLFFKRLSDAREGVRKVCGDEVADKIKPLWGLDEEGELNGCYRDLGYQGLWYIMGELNHG